MLVIGDSLVAGTGAAPGEGWPEALGRATGWQMINAGVPGNTSGDAFGRLDALLARHAPAAVIIAVGGNDFLRQVPLETTHEHLVRMVSASRAAAAHVAIMAVPELSMNPRVAMSYEHCRGRIVERVKQLAGVFAIDVA